MAGIASPKGEQAKTDIDRIKKSIQVLRDRWGLEDTEKNQATVRAYRHGKLCCEMFKFSLMPTTSNESKTLNVLAIEESHKADHKKRSDELDPMLASTGGVTWHIGVGATVVSDFTRGCNGELPDSVSIKCDVDEVIRDRRKRYEETNDPIHLAYEHKFEAELRKKGRQNPEIRRNYYLEDTVEEGNFISRERLVSCARPSNVIVPTDKLFLGGDWARRSDHTWFAIGNDKNDIIDWLKVPHAPYEEQVQIAKEWLYADRVAGVILTESWRYAATPQEERAMRQMKCCVQVQASDGDESFYVFTLQSKNSLYLNFETALYRDIGDPLRFSYPADHPLASEFEEQMIALLKEWKGEGEYLSVHHPDEQGARDDAPDCTALMLMGAASGSIGEILFG